MAFDAFLKIETPNSSGRIDGRKHKGEIEIYSFSLGASNPTTIGSEPPVAPALEKLRSLQLQLHEEDGQDEPGTVSGSAPAAYHYDKRSR